MSENRRTDHRQRTGPIVERYVHAALRTVPASRREEIGRELRASIGELVEARTESGEPVEDAERAVLSELGDPDRLAAQYTGMNQVLIGPRYFLTWWRVLTRLLVIVPVVVMIVVAVVGVLDETSFGDVVGDVVGAGLGVAFQVAFWTTLAFALIDRFDLQVDLPEWSVDQLPDRPERSVSAADTIASVVFYAVVMVVIVVQHFAGWVSSGGDSGPALDPDLWSFWLPLLLVVFALNIVVEVVTYVRGDWTWALAVGNAVLCLAFLVPMVYLLLQQMLFSDVLVEALNMTDEVERNIGVGVSIGLVLVIAWEIVDGFVRAARASRGTKEAVPA